jgi:parallel beta-helix repeat protein
LIDEMNKLKNDKNKEIKKMKNRTVTLASLALALSAVNSPLSTFAQGSLTPPGPPGPTMKTLDQIEARTPISSLPYVINSPGSYYLTTNLTSPGSGDGITISSGNVTIDLNGFTLQGLTGSGSGIVVPDSYCNLVVRNGTVTGWGGRGVDSYTWAYPRNMLFETLTVSSNYLQGIKTEAGSIVRDCLSLFNGADGIWSEGGEIVHCTSRGNSGIGVTAFNCTVQGCRSEFNSPYGVYLSRSRALDCAIENTSGSFSGNGIGVFVDNTGNELRRCRIASNVDSGIFCNLGSGGNTISDCTIANNGNVGIQQIGTGGSFITGNNIFLNLYGGIVIRDSNNRVENNLVQTPSGMNGIMVIASAWTNNVIIKNTVCGGGSSSVNYYNPGSNDFGPIGTAATASSPWANISQ